MKLFLSDLDGKGLGNRGFSSWMQYVGPSPEALHQNTYCHHWVLVRITRVQRKRHDHRITYKRAEITERESIETRVRMKRRLWAATLIEMSDVRLLKRIVLGNLEGAVKGGRGGKEKKRFVCIES